MSRSACEPVSKPAPHGPHQHLVAGQYRRLRHGIGRMDIDHRAERVGAFPKRIELGGVEILPVGVAIDHGAAELQLTHAAFQLIGGAFCVLHRQMSESGITVGPLRDFACEKVIGLARSARGRSRVALGLYARAGDRQDGARDTGFVHAFEAQPAEIGEIAKEIFGALRRDFRHRRPPVIDQAGRQEVLLERDFADHAFPRCLVYRVYIRYPVQWYMAQCYKRPNAWAGEGGLPWSRRFAASRWRKTSTILWGLSFTICPTASVINRRTGRISKTSRSSASITWRSRACCRSASPPACTTRPTSTRRRTWCRERPSSTRYRCRTFSAPASWCRSQRRSGSRSPTTIWKRRPARSCGRATW